MSKRTITPRNKKFDVKVMVGQEAPGGYRRPGSPSINCSLSINCTCGHVVLWSVGVEMFLDITIAAWQKVLGKVFVMVPL